MHYNLRSFLDTLRKEKDLIEIDAEVDPNLELPEIHRRIIDEGGPALLFTNPKGGAFPVVTNLFGTERRVELAFGPRPERIVQQLVGFIDQLLPPHIKSLWEHRGPLMDVARTGLKYRSPGQAPVLDVKEKEVDLTRLPALTGWQLDGGLFSHCLWFILNIQKRKNII